jgi:hypothetical protein
MQPEIHPSATTYSVQNSISDTLIPIPAAFSSQILAEELEKTRGHRTLPATIALSPRIE